MIDNEIIKALEFCSGDKLCRDGCPFNDECGKDLDSLEKACIDLINRQKAEIERLKADIEKMQDRNFKLFNIIFTFRRKVETAEPETIKEFVKQLKDRVVKKYAYTDVRIFNEIDNLVKEMEGENDG